MDSVGVFGRFSVGRIVPADPNDRITTYTFDGIGRVLTAIDPSGRTTTNSYDNAGGLTHVDYSDPATPDVSIAYGNAGQRLTMTDGSGTQTWTHDSLGRMTSHTNGVGATVNYGYSIRGELLTVGYPGRGTVVRSYDDDGTLHGVTDWNSNTTTFAYDKNGALTTTNYANGVVGTNTYDNPGRLTNIAYVKSASTLANYAYGRTAGGDVSAETSTGTSAGANKTYTYNTLGQLASENSGTFGYDAADNLTSINGATQTYEGLP